LVEAVLNTPAIVVPVTLVKALVQLITAAVAPVLVLTLVVLILVLVLVLQETSIKDCTV
jgi:hypothetical protein